MKSNNRRLYRRILAFMLVVLLVLPQGLSSMKAKAKENPTLTGVTIDGVNVSSSEGGYTTSASLVFDTEEGLDIADYRLDFFIDGNSSAIATVTSFDADADNPLVFTGLGVASETITKSDQLYAMLTKISTGEFTYSSNIQSPINYPPKPAKLTSAEPVVDPDTGVISVTVDNEDNMTTINDCTYSISFKDINDTLNTATGNVTTVSGNTASFTLSESDKARLKSDDYTVNVVQDSVTATTSEQNNFNINISNNPGDAQVLLDNASVGSSFKVNKNTAYQIKVIASEQRPKLSVSLDGFTPVVVDDDSKRFQIATIDISAGTISSDKFLTVTSEHADMTLDFGFRVDKFYEGYKYTVQPIVSNKVPSDASVGDINISIDNAEIVSPEPNEDGTVTVNENDIVTFKINPDAKDISDKFTVSGTIVNGSKSKSIQKDISQNGSLRLKYYSGDKEITKDDMVNNYYGEDLSVVFADDSNKYSEYKVTDNTKTPPIVVNWTAIPTNNVLTTCTAEEGKTENYTLFFKSYMKTDNTNDSNYDMNTSEVSVGIDKTKPKISKITIISYSVNKNDDYDEYTQVSSVDYEYNNTSQKWEQVDPDAKNALSAAKRVVKIEWSDNVAKGSAFYKTSGDFTDLIEDEIPITNNQAATDYTIKVTDHVGNETETSISVPAVSKLEKSKIIVKNKRTYEDKPDTYYMKKGEEITFSITGLLEIDKDELVAKVEASPSSGVDISEEQTDAKIGIGQTRTYTITAKEDGEYTISYEFKDPSITNTISGDFDMVVDTVKPEIMFNDKIDDKSTQQIISKAKTPLKVIEEVRDDVSGLNKYRITVVKADKADGTLINIDSVNDTLFDGNGPKKADIDKYSLDEGRYILEYTVFDRSGNKTTKTINFILDITSPTYEGYSIKPVSSDGQTNTKYKDYQYFDKNQVEVTITAKDPTSGIKDVVVEKDGVIIDRELTTINNGDGKAIYGAKFTIPVTYKGKIGIKITDIAGHVTDATINSEKFSGVITENGTAESSVSLSTSPSSEKIFLENGIETEYYNSDMGVSIRAEDGISGIKNVYVYNNDTNKTLNSYTNYTSKTAITTSDDMTCGISDQGEYTVQAKLTDNAGNIVSSNTKRIIIDKTVPVISSNVETVAKEYNNADVSVGVTIEEKYLNNNNTTIKIYNNGSLEKTITGGFSTSGTTNTSSIPFTSDGKYYFTVETTDKAGNTAQMYKSKEFTVDKTNPKLTLTFNNNNVRNERYYNAERIGTLTVEEHNFDASLVDVKVNVTDSAEGVGTPSIGGFSSSGDTHTASIPFSQDATYEITVSAKDKADNNSDQTITESFVVDLTDPEIKFSNVEEEALYSGIVRPDVEVTDRNYDNSGTTITLVSSRDNGAAAKNLEDTYKVSSIANGEKFTYDNFKNEEANDDYYTIKAVAQDKAGNTSEKTIGFMVNRFGSYFTLNDYTAQLVKAVYTNLEGDDDIVISAHNLADIEESKVYFTVGEDTKTLDENDGYKITKKTGDDHWNVSSYTFDKSLFESEGEYNIVVSTKDSEGNVADNEAKDAPVSFIIDRTAPEYIVSGIEDGQNYEDQDKVSGTIELHDNIGVAKADVTIDGTKSTYEGKELDDMNYSVPVEFSKGSHTIEVKVYDLAGNESDDDDGISFSVNQTAAERAIAKATKSFWWIFVIIGAVAAAGIIIFVVAKRKSEE